jgi:hypothetical protein
MADGFHVDIDDDLAERLSRAAAAAGMTKGEFACLVLEQHLFDYDAYDWDDDDPRLVLAGVAEPTEGARPLDEVMGEFKAELEKRLARKR